MTQSMPTGVIATSPPPTATTAPPDIASSSAAIVRGCSRVAPSETLDERDDGRVRVEDERDRGGRAPFEPHVEERRLDRVEEQPERERREALPDGREQRPAHDRERGEQQKPREAEADTERDARRHAVARDGAAEEDRAAEAERSERGEPEVEVPLTRAAGSPAEDCAGDQSQHEQATGPAGDEERDRREPQRPHRVRYRRHLGLRLPSTPSTCGP